jgi:hypothetical protein
MFFEGYFMLNHTRMGSMTDFFGQLWKEYALSDSRYMTSDPFVLVMESYTTVRALIDKISPSFDRSRYFGDHCAFSPPCSSPPTPHTDMLCNRWYP